MKIVVFGKDARLGVVQQDRILGLAAAADAAGLDVASTSGAAPFTSLLALIEAGEYGLDLVRRLADDFAGSDQPGLHADLFAEPLHAPFPGRRFAAAGSNHAAHVANARINSGKPADVDEIRATTRQGPGGGFWTVSPPVGDDAEIPVPKKSRGMFDYEGEVAIVLGKGGKGIRAEGWRDHVWGVTLVIDWSIRDGARPTRMPFYAHKVFDGSKSLGPWIAVDEVDPLACMVETRVNGELRQRFVSGEMIHSYGELLEQISEDFTLLPGDILSGGTGAGTAVDSTVPDGDGQLPLDLFLKPGDRVEVSAPSLGTLRATIVANT